jgi:hypothetical protein
VVKLRVKPLPHLDLIEKNKQDLKKSEQNSVVKLRVKPLSCSDLNRRFELEKFQLISTTRLSNTLLPLLLQLLLILLTT